MNICACAYDNELLVLYWYNGADQALKTVYPYGREKAYNIIPQLVYTLYPYTLPSHAPLSSSISQPFSLYELRTQRLCHSRILIIFCVSPNLHFSHSLSLSAPPPASKVMEIITLFLSFCICLSCPGFFFKSSHDGGATRFFDYYFLSMSSILLHSLAAYAFSNFTFGFVSIS